MAAVTTSIGASTGSPVNALPSTTTSIPPASSAQTTFQPQEAPVQGGVVTEKEPASDPPRPNYIFDVKMTCGGCSGAINRVLGKYIEAPNQFDVSLDTQKARVWGPNLPPYDEVLAKIKKTGKAVNEETSQQNL